MQRKPCSRATEFHVACTVVNFREVRLDEFA